MGFFVTSVMYDQLRMICLQLPSLLERAESSITSASPNHRDYQLPASLQHIAATSSRPSESIKFTLDEVLDAWRTASYLKGIQKQDGLSEDHKRAMQRLSTITQDWVKSAFEYYIDTEYTKGQVRVYTHPCMEKRFAISQGLMDFAVILAEIWSRRLPAPPLLIQWKIADEDHISRPVPQMDGRADSSPETAIAEAISTGYAQSITLRLDELARFFTECTWTQLIVVTHAVDDG